ncbi:helix-turn-helix transcriptional regulator [bacterium]|nr:helix-turn-helix transcriptional regulator [bacterium]
MQQITSQEETLLLGVLALGDNAYGMTIRRHVSKVTGKDWSIGAIYDPLYRLERRDLVSSFLADPTAERGGRSKRMFRVTELGKAALQNHRAVRDRLWESVPGTAWTK